MLQVCFVRLLVHSLMKLSSLFLTQCWPSQSVCQTWCSAFSIIKFTSIWKWFHHPHCKLSRQLSIIIVWHCYILSIYLVSLVSDGGNWIRWTNKRPPTSSLHYAACFSHLCISLVNEPLASSIDVSINRCYQLSSIISSHLAHNSRCSIQVNFLVIWEYHSLTVNKINLRLLHPSAWLFFRSVALSIRSHLLPPLFLSALWPFESTLYGYFLFCFTTNTSTSPHY